MIDPCLVQRKNLRVTGVVRAVTLILMAKMTSFPPVEWCFKLK